MDKLWICFLLVVVAFGAEAQSDEAAFPEYWSSDEKWYDDELKNLGIKTDDNNQDVENNQQDADLPDYYDDKDENKGLNQNDDNDSQVQREIDEFRSENENDDLKDLFASENDYQYEDNRSDLKEEQADEEMAQLPSNVADQVEENQDENREDLEENKEINPDDETQSLLDGDIDTDFEDTNKLEENIDQSNLDDLLREASDILQETDSLLNENKIVEEVVDEKLLSNENSANVEDTDASDNEDKIPVEQGALVPEQPEEIIEEAKQILTDDTDSFDEPAKTNDEDNSEVQQSPIEDNILSNNEDEDTVDKVYEDLNSDLDKLFGTITKLQADDVEEKINAEAVDEDYNVQDYEEKNGRPYREGEVLEQRDYDYEQVEGDNLNEIFEEIGKAEASDENIADPNNIEKPEIDNVIDEQDASEALMKLNENDAAELPTEEENANIEDTESIVPSTTFRTKQVNELTSAEYDNLMAQFAVSHSEDLDVNAPGFDRNIGAIHITLNTDEAVVVQSPNYPSPYPTNNIVDWIFDGDGMGIEFVLTDFAVNGALGDYLLIKPGGVDETGTEGLIFSYNLNEPRKYRFLSVDKMFVRFESKLGMAFTRGFSFTVKLIGPRPDQADTVITDEDEIEEPVIAAPNSTLTITLGGLPLQDFKIIKEEFRIILADMATMYINTKDINRGLYTTLEVTQITSAVMCNQNWPNFEVCSDVTFGIPLHYETRRPDDKEHLTEEELQEMWDMYSFIDPFASRIRRLGITEFSAPNDRGVLSLWIVLMLGILISAALLALALWRFSCHDSYKRMPSFSEENFNEKRGLDLYPTPHQTLPPLYGNSDNKWSDNLDTRVDVGGFTNTSYTPDELGDLDSEDDVINQHRNHDIRPKDIYQLV